MNGAYSFFCGCWSWRMVADIMATMCNMLPRIYSALEHVISPFAVMLSASWFAWRLVDSF